MDPSQACTCPIHWLHPVAGAPCFSVAHLCLALPQSLARGWPTDSLFPASSVSARWFPQPRAAVDARRFLTDVRRSGARAVYTRSTAGPIRPVFRSRRLPPVRLLPRERRATPQDQTSLCRASDACAQASESLPHAVQGTEGGSGRRPLPPVRARLVAGCDRRAGHACEYLLLVVDRAGAAVGIDTGPA